MLIISCVLTLIACCCCAYRIEKALEKYESRREIDIEYFVRFGKEHPALLFPAVST